MTAAVPAAPTDTRPRIVEANRRAVRFIAEAEAFAERRAGALCFRYLQWLTGCTDAQRAQIVKKIFADSLLEGTTRFEGRGEAILKSLLHPFHYAVSKEYFWRPAAKVDFDLEISNAEHFRTQFEAAFAPVRGSKRLTQTSRPGPVPGYETVGPITASVSLSVLLKLLLAPLWIPQLLWLAPPVNRPNILSAYRRALGLYASHEGHFHRYPCRHFVTYSDENNHPIRWLAFKKWCDGLLIAVQNGERQPHPYMGFSKLDAYLTFGPFTETLYGPMKMDIARTAVVGAPCLNERRALVDKLEKERPPLAYDVLFIDEKVYPYNGLDYKTGATSFYKMFDNLNRYKKNRPRRRVAYQLRDYTTIPAHRVGVLEVLKRHFTEDIELLENDGKGQSYANIYRSKVVITFNSTLGYESFFVRKGVKTLFVNYADNPHEILSSDPRFQIYDESGDYAEFESQLDFLVDLELDDIPAVARERHAYFDGKVQERIAAFLNEVA